MSALETQRLRVVRARADFSETWDEIKNRTKYPELAQEFSQLLQGRTQTAPYVFAGVTAAAAWGLGRLFSTSKIRNSQLPTLKDE